MKNPLEALADRARHSVAIARQVAIQDCCHHRGYRYGGFGYNPYEDYVVGLARKEARSALRQHFAWLVLNCRARTMAEALQIPLPAEWPLWEFPWSNRGLRRDVASLSPQENPDIMCHFSPGGVLASHVNREFGWLEAAWDSISQNGYLPKQYGYIRCMELSSPPVQSRYIVLDGNHRISAMHAAGLRIAEVQVLPLRRVRRERVSDWSRVRDGSLDAKSALCIFDRYFEERNPAPVPRHPARLLHDEAPLWPEGQNAIAPRLPRLEA